MNSASLWITILSEITLIELLVIFAGYFTLRKYRRVCSDLKLALREVRQVAPCLLGDAYTSIPLRPEATLSFDSQVLPFLQRQAHQSHIKAQQRQQVEPSQALETDFVWALREHYLKAEVKALSGESEGSQGYWQSLEIQLVRLLKKASRLVSSGPELKQWQRRSELLRERLEHFKSIESDYKQAQRDLSVSQKKILTLEKLASTQQENHNNANKVAELNRLLKRTELGRDACVPILSERDVSEHNTQHLSERIHSQRELIEQLSKQLRAYELGGAAESVDQQEGERVAQLSTQVARLEDDLSTSERLIEQLKSSLQHLRAKREAALAVGALSRPAAAGAHGDNDIRIIGAKTKDTDTALDYERARGEAERLSELVSQQKRTIERFSKELAQLRIEVLGRVSKDELEEKEVRIGRLERFLGESETCVGMLEGELDALQQQLKVVHQELDEAEPAEGGGALARDLGAELASMEEMLNTTMKAYADQSHLIQLAMRGVNCVSVHDLGRELLSCLDGLDLEAAVTIKGGSEEIDVFDKKKVSLPERKQLKQIDLLSATRITRVPAGVVVTFHNVACLLKSNRLNDERRKEIQDLVTSMLSLVSVFIERVDSGEVIGRQKKMLDQLVRSTHQTIKDINVQYKYQSKEATLTIDRFMGEVNMAIKTINLREVDRNIFMGMITDCQERMALLFATGLTINDTMQRLMATLDKKRQ